MSPISAQESSQSEILISSIAPPLGFEAYLNHFFSENDEFALGQEWHNPEDSDLVVIFIADGENDSFIPQSLLGHYKFLQGLGWSTIFVSKNIDAQTPFENIVIVKVAEFGAIFLEVSGRRMTRPLLACVSAARVAAVVFESQDRLPDYIAKCEAIIVD